MVSSGYLTSKGQTTVPKAVRDMLGIEVGARLDWSVDADRLIVTTGKRSVAGLAGVLENPLGRPVSIEEMREGAAEAATDRFGRSLDRR